MIHFKNDIMQVHTTLADEVKIIVLVGDERFAVWMTPAEAREVAAAMETAADAAEELNADS